MNLRRGFSSLAEHSVFVSSEGTIFSWGKRVRFASLTCQGNNRVGSLGVGNTHSHKDPCSISLPGKVSLACGEHHTIALLQDGSLFSWGSNSLGQIGQGAEMENTKFFNVPTRVTFAEAVQVTSVYAGASFCVAITRDGELFVWGATNFLLGRNTHSPTRLPTTHRFVEVSCGWGHMVGITTDGRAYSWGISEGQFLLDIKEEVVSVAAGTGFCFLLTASGGVYVVGGNSYVCQDRENSHLPSLIIEKGVQVIAAGGNHVLAIMEDGGLVGWGWNIYGQVGLGHSESVNAEPHPLPFPPSLSPDREAKEAIGVGCGWGFSWIITKDQSLYVWGSAHRGYLANTDTYSPDLLPWIKVELPKMPKEEVWQKTFFWLCLGQIDSGSAFFGIPTEVLWNLLKLEYR